MAKVLRTTGIVYNIDELITSAKKEIVIISPYNKLSQNYLERLKAAKDKGVSITLCYGKKEIDADVFSQVSKLCKLYYYENLHAKCYYNENMMIIASMNLYEASEKNREMGVLITNAGDDIEMYKDGKIECEDIIKNAVPIDKKGAIQKNDFAVKREEYKGSKTNGYCIRCKKVIPFDVEKPMCKDCFSTWDQFGDETYQEKYCHFSGEPSNGETSFAKPILKKNWSAAKEKMK